jgi:hypothetical protein
MTVSQMQLALWRYYEKRGHIAWALNTQALGHEADFVTVSRAHRATEIEIKRSRADFRADFEKTDKHEQLLCAHQNRPVPPKIYGTGRSKVVIPRAYLPQAHFYYACPAGLLTPADLPPYAGLLHIAAYPNAAIPGQVTLVRPAPRLHDVALADDTYHRLLQSMMYRALRLTTRSEGTSDPLPSEKF